VLLAAALLLVLLIPCAGGVLRPLLGAQEQRLAFGAASAFGSGQMADALPKFEAASVKSPGA